MPSTSGYAPGRVSPCGRAFSLLLCLGACAKPAAIAAQGPIRPQVGRALRVDAKAKGSELAPKFPAPPASSPPPSPTPTAAAPFGALPFSTAAPTLIEQASRDGRWVALCRMGKDEAGKDAKQHFLIAPGEELAIDAWLGATPDGRFVLFQQSGALVLWNAETRQTVDLSALGADSRLSAESNAALRVLDFDAKSERLLYLRRGNGSSRVVLRALNDGSERELDPGPGEVWRARFDPGGRFVTLQVITEDTNKNGKLDFPAPLLARPRACGDSLGHFRAWEGRGDRPETVLLPLTGEAAIHEPLLLMPVQDALLLRDADGALLLARAGKKRPLESAACKGRIVHADAERELFIVGCAQKKRTGRVSLELVTREGRKPLEIELASVELDREISDSPRLIALYPGSDSLLFDTDRKQLISLEPGDSVLAMRAARALVRRGKDLLIYDADARRELPLPGVVDKFPDILRALPFVFVSPLLINLDTAVVAGTSKQRPLALTPSGQILVADSDADAPNWARGPLHWLTPPLPAPAP